MIKIFKKVQMNKGIYEKTDFIESDTILIGHTKPITGLKYFHSQNATISSSLDATIRIWRIAPAMQILKDERNEDGITALEVVEKKFPFSQYIIYSGTETGQINIWYVVLQDGQDGNEDKPKLTKIPNAHSAKITAIASNFGLTYDDVIATASIDKTIKIWKPSLTSDGAHNLDPVQVIDAHESPIRSLKYHSGHNLISADSSGRVNHLYLREGKYRLKRTYKSIKSGIMDLQLNKIHPSKILGVSEGNFIFYSPWNAEFNEPFKIQIAQLKFATS